METQEEKNMSNLKIPRNEITDNLLLTIGAILAAFAVEDILVPCMILDGGIVGISIMINNLSGVPLGLLTTALNIPFLLIGARKMGLRFVAKSAYAMVVFSVFLGIFEHFTNVTYDALLAVCFGGVLLGLGVGLVIRFGGCLDGTETVAILLNKKFGLPVGEVVLGINIVIYTIAGVLFGFDRAMYSLLTYFITSKALDIIETGLEQAKAAMIITNEAREIAEKIYSQLGRTVTILKGKGLISGDKVILYCVINRFEIYELKRIINSIDGSAFVSVSDVSEIIGNHVKKKDGRIKNAIKENRVPGQESEENKS